MGYSAIAVANAFIERAKHYGINDLSPMKLQKLVYFAHAWHLALTGKPLIDEPVCAWRYGPVVPSVYNAFRGYGSGHIPTPAVAYEYSQGVPFPIIPTVNDKESAHLIDAVMNTYGNQSAIFLSNLTHQTGSAWDVTKDDHRQGQISGCVIPNEVIRNTTRVQLGMNVDN
ncbi:Panacea domain-containing protein [Pectobacterium aroidearum]|uniref:Panacea domain-containing protein n=1 Tax=Pectobacterium aroidearum TaxID=1201031 RepID=UPI0032EF7741